MVFDIRKKHIGIYYKAEGCFKIWIYCMFVQHYRITENNERMYEKCISIYLYRSHIIYEYIVSQGNQTLYL